MNRSEIAVMDELLNQNCTNQVKATTINALSESIGTSYFSVRNILRGLVLGEYCGMGMKNGRAETYFLTLKGIEKIKEFKESEI